jgi:uncharacterized protein (DUF488 family)
MRLYTVGHSIRPLPEFLGILRAHGIKRLIDVRTVPRSRRQPHFTREALAASLEAAGVTYEHAPDLGGLRSPDPASLNGGLDHPQLRAYADHMRTPEFDRALNAALEHAAREPTAVMCAEADWRRCHRQLLADAATVSGAEVIHLLGRDRIERHRMHAAAHRGRTRTLPARTAAHPRSVRAWSQSAPLHRSRGGRGRNVARPSRDTIPRSIIGDPRSLR